MLPAESYQRNVPLAYYLGHYKPNIVVWKGKRKNHARRGTGWVVSLVSRGDETLANGDAG
jgi:hypothetical protein